MKPFVLIKKFRPQRAVGALLLICFALCAVSLGQHITEVAAAKSGQPLKGKVIAVDAGHGGADPGAVGVSGTLEKDINLILAKKLEILLKEKGAVVVMTRTDDHVFSDVKRAELDHRAELVKEHNADLFLSLQCNAVPNSALRGAQTFYYPDSKKGKQLAEAIQNRFIKTLKNTDREALTLSSAYIMSKLEIPAIMVEVGFLSNAEEESLLVSDAYQEQIVAAIYGGITDYYEKQDSEESWFDMIFNYFDKE
ncbi:MAG: N-acetylmuramoyl-L-alanine amidase [Firmicutes bacterium]|nr:N-acetylmuramoyl-L-alanine amidase [Bacillota bacterium]